MVKVTELFHLDVLQKYSFFIAHFSKEGKVIEILAEIAERVNVSYIYITLTFFSFTFLRTVVSVYIVS